MTNPILIPVAIGIVGGLYVLIDFIRNWPEWLGYESGPSTHIAGPDDEEIDFEAALRSIGRVPR